MEHTWTCSCCGRSFNSLPMNYAFAVPANWFALSEAERVNTRSKLDANLCVIDRKEYYVRGCLEIPVSDSPEIFVWGVWVSVSEASFRNVLDHWTSPIDPDEPPRFGWLCNWIRGYPEPRLSSWSRQNTRWRSSNIGGSHSNGSNKLSPPGVIINALLIG